MIEILTIERITRKRHRRIVVFSNGEEYPIMHHMIKENHLIPGRQIEREEFNRIKVESDFMRADYYVGNLLGARSYSTGLINQKLYQKGYDRETISKIIRIYVEKGYLDDLKYARAMVQSMLLRKPAGKGYLMARLRAKFIPMEMARDVVEEYLADTDESEMAYTLLKARWSYLSKFDLESARRKAYNYLSRRSIGYTAARKAFEKISQEG